MSRTIEDVPTDPRPILFFDGVCNLCNASVNFVLKRDKAGRFRFATLQSPAAAELLDPFGLKASDLDTVVLLEDGRAYTRSTAALRVARRLRFPWNLLYAFILLPRFVRDPLYRFVARRRYRWFGKTETCRVPTPEVRSRFVG